MMKIECPIFKRKIKDHSEFKDSALIAINNQKARIQANDLDIMSDYDIDRDVPRPYMDFIEDRIYDTLTEFTREMKGAFFQGFEVRNFFYQQYTKNQYHSWHCHDCQFSGVYYLDMPSGTPKTEYRDPFTDDVHEFDIEEGDVVAFPSFLIHRAPPNMIDIPKTIISFNFNFWNKDQPCQYTRLNS